MWKWIRERWQAITVTVASLPAVISGIYQAIDFAGNVQYVSSWSIWSNLPKWLVWAPNVTSMMLERGWILTPLGPVIAYLFWHKTNTKAGEPGASFVRWWASRIPYRIVRTAGTPDAAGGLFLSAVGTVSDPPSAPPVPEPPVELVLNPDRALPTALRSDESYEGMTIGAGRAGDDVLLTVSNHRPSGTFVVRFQLTRIEGSIDPIGEATNCLSWAPPTGELFHPSQAEQVFPYCGLAYRDMGRIRIGFRERTAYSREISLFCFTLDGRKRTMREMIRVKSFADQALRIEVDVSVERVISRHGDFYSGQRECHGRLSLLWNDGSSEPVVTVQSTQDIVGPDDGELRTGGDAGERSDTLNATNASNTGLGGVQGGTENQSDSALPEGDLVRIDADMPGWAHQFLAAMRPTHQALRQVVSDYWGATSPEGQEEYQELKNREQNLRNVLENQARSEIIEEVAIAYYLGYRDYVDKIYSHMSVPPNREKIIARSDYTQWEQRDDILASLIRLTTGGPGSINHFQAAVTKRGPTVRL